MGRPVSPKRLEALKMWLRSGRKRKLKDIAIELEVSPEQVRKWKSLDKWSEIPNTPPRRGAPYRNRNAVGNKGGLGGPIGNDKAVKHGLYRRWMPDDQEALEIYDVTREGMSTLDILYEEILISFTNFIRAQKIMYVKDHEDMTKEIKKQKSSTSDNSSYEEVEYDIQYAWDKQAKALTAQAAAMRALSTKIKQYEELLRTLPPDEVKEEHRLKAEKLKADIKSLESKAW